MAKRKPKRQAASIGDFREPLGALVNMYVPLDDGRMVSLFVNRDTNLIVLDVVDANERGGVEVYRRNV